MKTLDAPVAEWMRQGTSNPFYAGSNPAGGAINIQVRAILTWTHGLIPGL